MCESCDSWSFPRRHFLATGVWGTGAVIGGIRAVSAAVDAEAADVIPPREKKPARVTVAFLYPPADVVNAGENEDTWRVHHWFTWPGNQFEPEQQAARFRAKIEEIGENLGITLTFEPQPIYQEARVNAFIEKGKREKPDAVLIVNFWNSFSKWSYRMATECETPTAIVYHPVGSNHQLPPEYLRKAEGLYYIHAIENWEEIERGLRAVRARTMLAQSRMLRVSGKVQEPKHGTEKRLGVDLVEVPAAEYNQLFDRIEVDDPMRAEAAAIRKKATEVRDVTEAYCVEAIRAHRAVNRIMAQYGADAITIECLMLKHRKPCISFAMNNGNLVPCGCENDLNATLTMMLGKWLLERAGFQHNPEFDLSDNRYFGAHCTCAWNLHGPDGAVQPYLIRPFFHQLPKTPALDVQWTPGEEVVLARYVSGQDTLHCWTGKVIKSPTTPPTGGCATRVLVKMDDIRDVCDIYPGPHPILYCATPAEAKRFKAFARMYRLKIEGNV